MAYRNGTYIAFHADGTNKPGESDIDYYNLMKAWSAKTDDDFTMINSHEKASAVRDTSKKKTLRASLLQRLRNSKNMVLIVGETTKLDNDWVPFEIENAVDQYALPIIAVYPEYDYILDPKALKPLWPLALRRRIDNHSARVIHIPFKKRPIAVAIGQFTHANPPKSGLTYYTRETYQKWGIIS